MGLSAGKRYWMAQVPGWVVAGVGLWLLWQHLGVPGWLAALLFAGFVAKDLVFYPFAVRTLESPARAGHEGLLGRRATVVDPLDPVGRVSLEGEFWRARLDGSGPVGRGAGVTVERVEGLTLHVRPVAPEPAAAPAPGTAGKPGEG